MQTYIDCYPCVLRQAIEASRMAGADQFQQREVILGTLHLLGQLPQDATPPAIVAEVHRIVRKITHVDDPYKQVKQAATRQALRMLSGLQSLLNDAENQLETAVRLSIAGNIIDFGPNPDYDLWEVVHRVLSQDFLINDFGLLKARMTSTESVLFLGDNAGETVFDRLLIERIPATVTYVVRGGPILNDATYDDAVAAGIDRVAEVIDNGARIPGTFLSECSPSFQARFNSAELILAKGMGNYESLSTTSRPVFFLMQVKCPVIGADVGAYKGSIIVKLSNSVI